MPLAKFLGGSEKALLDFVEYHPEPKNLTIVLLTDGPMLQTIKSFGAECRVIPSGKLSNIGLFVRTECQIVRLIREKNPDKVIGWMNKGQIYASLPAFLLRRNNYWIQMGLPSSKDGIDIIARILPTRKIICCSRFIAKEQEKFWPKRKTSFVHLGYNDEEFNAIHYQKSDSREKLDLPNDKIIIGFVGRLQHWKGVHILIEAISLLSKKHKNILCLIVGPEHPYEADYTEELQKIIQKNNLRGSIKFVGMQNNIPEWISAMDIFVHASIAEPFGIVIVEAMAMGKPIVAAADGGPLEIITHAKNGLLFDPISATDLKHKLEILIENRKLMAEISSNAATRAKHFTSRSFVLNLLKSFDD